MCMAVQDKLLKADNTLKNGRAAQRKVLLSPPAVKMSLSKYLLSHILYVQNNPLESFYGDYVLH